MFSTFPSVKIGACLSELPETEPEGSVVPINEVAWSAMCETKGFVILIVVFSILVEQSCHGIVGRSFAVALFPMVPIFNVLTAKKIFGHTWRFPGCVDGLNRKRDFDVLRDKLGLDVTP